MAEKSAKMFVEPTDKGTFIPTVITSEGVAFKSAEMSALGDANDAIAQITKDGFRGELISGVGRDSNVKNETDNGVQEQPVEVVADQGKEEVVEPVSDPLVETPEATEPEPQPAPIEPTEPTEPQSETTEPEEGEEGQSEKED